MIIQARPYQLLERYIRRKQCEEGSACEEVVTGGVL